MDYLIVGVATFLGASDGGHVDLSVGFMQQIINRLTIVRLTPEKYFEWPIDGWISC
jgi:hypothetical protein